MSLVESPVLNVGLNEPSPGTRSPGARSIEELRLDPSSSLRQIVAAVLTAGGEQPALGRRAREIHADPGGEASVRLLSRFATWSYDDLRARVTAVAGAWRHGGGVGVKGGDRVCMLGFAGPDYVAIDLAAILSGAVSVPLATGTPEQPIIDALKETEPRCFAVSIDYLELGASALVKAGSGADLLIFDRVAGFAEHDDRVAAARALLAQAGHAGACELFDEVCARALPGAWALEHGEGDSGEALSTIHYTSGSTGSPKGVMWPERMVAWAWRARITEPRVCLNYLPMNHSYGRTQVFTALATGGACYFVASPDLSTLLEDLVLVRPNQMAFVPRVCELMFDRFLDIARERGVDPAGPERTKVVAEVREVVFGGRIAAASFGGAPLAPEVRACIEDCLGFPLSENYGSTEALLVTLNGQIARPPVLDFKLIDVPELGYLGADKPYPRGELLVKSSNMMTGYYKRPDLTAEVTDPDGFYRTGDIMALTGAERLAFVDRRNSVIKLSQGEFVALSNLEATFSGGDPNIGQIFLHGRSDKSFLVGMIVPAAEAKAALEEGDVAKARVLLRDALGRVAREAALASYEVPRDFIVEPEPFTIANGLLTGMRKPARGALKALYEARLLALYDEIESGRAALIEDLRREGRGWPPMRAVAAAMAATLGLDPAQVTARDNFTALGGDSLAALNLALLLEEVFGVELPVGVVSNPSSTVDEVVAYLRRAGEDAARASFSSVHGASAEAVSSGDLSLDKFVDPDVLRAAADLPPVAGSVRTVLLTGANGFLGRFLCLEWMARLATNGGGKVIALVRGRDAEAAKRRLFEAVATDDRLAARFAALAEHHLEVLAADMAERRLGLAAEDWRRLADEVDLIVHAGALVNHVLPYRQLFGTNVTGTADLIELALTGRLKRFAFLSTVGTIMLGGGRSLDEREDIRVALPTRPVEDGGYAHGYGLTKWAGEVLLREAHDRFGLPVVTFRPSMIMAHRTYAGQINHPDIFSRWLFSMLKTGIAPASHYVRVSGVAPHYDGLPVDFMSEAIVTLGVEEEGYRTYHLVNPNEDGAGLDRFVDWAVAGGHPITRIEAYEDWLASFKTKLSALPESERRRSVLPLIDALYAQPEPPMAGSVVQVELFPEAVRRAGVGGNGAVPQLDQDFILKAIRDVLGAA